MGKISAKPLAGPLTGDEFVVGIQGGVTKRFPAAALGGGGASGVTIDAQGALQGIGDGDGTVVANSALEIDAQGRLQGIGDGAGAFVDNGRVAVQIATEGNWEAAVSYYGQFVYEDTGRLSIYRNDAIPALGETDVPQLLTIADVTGSRTAAFIAGQGPWATSTITTARLNNINDQGRATSRRLLSQIVASGVGQIGFSGYFITASPLGASCTITINNHIITDDVGSQNFSAGSISGLNWQTRYYIYETNPDFSAGARTYVATISRFDLAAFGRRYVGTITTPTQGGTVTIASAWPGGPSTLVP